MAARDRSVRCATAARRSRRTRVGRSLGVALRALNLFHAAARPQRKADNCRPIPSSKSATRQTHESFIRHINCLMNSLPASERKELVCHECHAFPRSFSLFTPLLWVAAMLLLLLAARSVLQNRSSRKWSNRETIEWGQPRPSLIQRWTIRGQNPIQTTGIFAVADTRDRVETSAICPPEYSRRSAEGAYPADARTLWFDHRGARDQTQRGVRLGENEGNRMRHKLPRTPLHT